MATIGNPIASNPNPAPAPPPLPASNTNTGAIPGADQATFLRLLISQIQNQDPLNPTDSTQFVTQLAQFSELEQMTNVNSHLQQIQQELGGTPAQP
jgi:flagellar basal-body rod modification protein FlgD